MVLFLEMSWTKIEISQIISYKPLHKRILKYVAIWDKTKKSTVDIQHILPTSTDEAL